MIALAFAVFVAAMVACIISGKTIIIGLAIGLVMFIITGVRSGYELPKLMKMALGSAWDSRIVVETILMIGLITGLWRASGTIAFFVYNGLKVVAPPTFILLGFIMCCGLSYIMGNSFAVAGTLGVILMVMAQSCGVDPVVTAGMIISGIYFGDRASPASSCTILVTTVSETELIKTVKMMMKTAALPVVLTIALYTVLSILNPMQTTDMTILRALSDNFNLNLWTLIPVLFILIMPLLNIDIRIAFICGIAVSFLVAILFQDLTFAECFSISMSGFQPTDEILQQIISGGGMFDMVEVCIIIALACSYSGIFAGTDMLEDLQRLLSRLSQKTGRYMATLLVGLAASAVFCSQTIAVMLSRDFMGANYDKTEEGRYELAMDIANSTVMVCVAVPWSVAFSVPVAMLGAGSSALFYAYLIYLVPICYFFTKKRWFRNR